MGRERAFPESPAPAPLSMTLPPITMPEGEPGQWWWAQLTTGSGEREIDKPAAIRVCRIILRDTLGGPVAQATPIDFAQSEPIALRDLHAAIQELAELKDGLFCSRKAAMGKLIIDPQELAEICVALAAKELEEKKAEEPEAAVKELPARVRAFWEHRDPNTPQWRLESAEQRKEREFLEDAGTWTG
jgi:hypothetical protein